MRSAGRMMLWALLLLGLALAALWAFGPREPAVTNVRFDETPLRAGIDAYLAQTEARFDDITPGVHKQVIWSGQPETKTPIALVYLHGFSATSQEVRPLPDLVARALGANLVLTRLAGHGRDGAALADATVEDWMRDVAEALAIGRAVGERVIVIGTSTGATLATLALPEQMSRGVAGVVLISPNYRVRNPAAALLNWPAARWWLPLLAGRERGFEPQNDGHAHYWTPHYPSTAVFPMGAAVRAAAALSYQDITVPALFAFDDRDTVVDHSATRAVAARWGGPVTLHVVQVGAGDDVNAHVIAGDILSASMTRDMAESVVNWIGALE